MASRAPSQNVLDPRLLPPDTSASYADSTYALSRAPAPREPFGVGSGPKHNGPYYTEPRADEIPQIEDAHPRRYSMEGNEEDEQDARSVSCSWRIAPLLEPHTDFLPRTVSTRMILSDRALVRPVGA